MMGLAIRIAHSLQLHREESYQSFTFFEGQIRRRAFYCLLGLDFKASLDRGTDPAVPANSYNVKFAMNLNDMDFNPTSEKRLTGQPGYTDMTFFTIASEGAYLIRALNFVSVSFTCAMTEYVKLILLRPEKPINLHRHCNTHGKHDKML